MTAPLPGPLEEAPKVTTRQAGDMLMEALEGAPLGTWDWHVLDRVRFSEPAFVAGVASLLRRAWTAGLEAGRGEREEERA